MTDLWYWLHCNLYFPSSNDFKLQSAWYVNRFTRAYHQGLSANFLTSRNSKLAVIILLHNEQQLSSLHTLKIWMMTEFMTTVFNSIYAELRKKRRMRHLHRMHITHLIFNFIDLFVLCLLYSAQCVNKSCVYNIHLLRTSTPLPNCNSLPFRITFRIQHRVNCTTTGIIRPIYGIKSKLVIRCSQS